MPRQLMPVVMTPAQDRSESDGDTGDGTPDAERGSTLVAVERLREKSKRRGEEDRPTDALGAAGQDQHQRRLGNAAEQGAKGEDDEADREEESPSVAVGQGPRGEEHRGQRQGIGVDDPLHLAEARVQSRLDRRQGDDHDGDVQAAT